MNDTPTEKSWEAVSAADTDMVSIPIESSHVVFGDKQSSWRTTKASRLFRTIKRDFKERHRGAKNSNSWIPEAIEEFRERHRQEFQGSNSNGEDVNHDIVILCFFKNLQEAQQELSVDSSIRYHYPVDESSDEDESSSAATALFFRAPKIKETLTKYFMARDAPTLEDELVKYRSKFEELKADVQNQVNVERSTLLDDFDHVLGFVEQLVALSQHLDDVTIGGRRSLAQRVLKDIAPTQKLKKWWKKMETEMSSLPNHPPPTAMAIALPETAVVPLETLAFADPDVDDEKLVKEFYEMMSIDEIIFGKDHRARAYVTTYESSEFRFHFDRLNDMADNGFRGIPSATWYLDWAKQVSVDDYAKELDKSRKHCLNLLYRMYDDCKDDDEAIYYLRLLFKPAWVSNILQICLPMDIGNALCHMQVVRGPTSPRGIHWISRKHADEWQPLLENYKGFPSMNKRYEWLIGMFGLQNKSVFAEWTKPIFHRQWIHGGKDMHILEAQQRAGRVRLYP